MKIATINDVVASRSYTMRNASGESEVEFKLGKPFPSPEVRDGLEYTCPVSITLGGTTEFHGVAGIDAVQALLLGLSYVKSRLQQLNIDNGKSLTWLGGQPGVVDISISDLGPE